MFTTVGVDRPISGLTYSPVDERVYAVTDDGVLYVVEELRGVARKVGQVNISDLAFVPVAIGEGDVAIDQNSLNSDHILNVYFVAGADSMAADHLFLAQLNYSSCVGGPLSCLPTLSKATDLGIRFDKIGISDLSGATVSDSGVLFVLGFDEGGVPAVGGFDLASGALVGPITIPIMDPGLKLGGIDFDPATGVMHGVVSGGESDWYFTVDMTSSPRRPSPQRSCPSETSPIWSSSRPAHHRLFLGVDDVVGGVEQIGADFGNLGEGGGSIHGVKWNDVDGDGRIGPNEPLLPGFVIYIDENNNGMYDEGEPAHVTNDDPFTDTNETGQYWFSDLPPGDYTVREIQQDGWMQDYPNRQICLDFEDLDPGSQFGVGQTITTVGDDGQPMTAEVRSFNNGPGATPSNGVVYVDNFQTSGGTGLDLAMDNANLYFQFDPPLNGLSLLFDDGGSVNLSINGDERVLSDFSELNGQFVGGVQVLVMTNGIDEHGELRLVGQIDSFAIGGQELWIDHLCKQPSTSGRPILSDISYLDFEEDEPYGVGEEIKPAEFMPVFIPVFDDQGNPMSVEVIPFFTAAGQQLDGYVAYDDRGIAGGDGMDLQLSGAGIASISIPLCTACRCSSANSAAARASPSMASRNFSTASTRSTA